MADAVPNHFDDMEILDYRSNYAWFHSRGYGEDRARGTAMARMTLAKGVARLARFERGPPKDADLEGGEVLASICGSPDKSSVNALLHDDVLLPEWGKFAGVLSSAAPNERGYITLWLGNVQISQAVSDMLLQSFKRAPLRKLLLSCNTMGSHGINFVVGALRNNPRIEFLGVGWNHMKSARDAESLVTTVNHHPVLHTLTLYKCCKGQNNAVMSAIVPSLYYMKAIRLAGNHIGSHGALQISTCLASNPHLKILDLDDNLLNNRDAEVLANSLKTNNNLRQLHLRGNLITQAGTKCLTQAVHSHSGLNDLYNSNHTCKILSGDGFLSKVNLLEDPGLNRKRKILHALTSHNSGHTYAQSLDDVPVVAMPRVLAVLQEKNITAAQRLDALFRFIQKRNVPVLSMSSVGPKLRRSERVRKRKLMQLVEK